MFLKKVVLKSYPISSYHFLVLFEMEIVVKLDLQKICKKIWKRGEGICKRKGPQSSVMFKF